MLSARQLDCQLTSTQLTSLGIVEYLADVHADLLESLVRFLPELLVDHVERHRLVNHFVVIWELLLGGSAKSTSPQTAGPTLFGSWMNGSAILSPLPVSAACLPR